MTTIEEMPEAATTTDAADEAVSRPRDLWRRSDDQLIAGVAAGLADRLGVDASYVRAAFFVTAFAGGLGVVAYLVIWAMTATSVRDTASLVEATSRQKAGLVAIFLGLLFLCRAWGLWLGDAIVWPVAFTSLGAAVAWDRSGRENRFIAWAFPGLEDDVRPSTFKVVFGGLLTFVGLILFASGFDAFDQLGMVLLAVIVTGIGVSLTVGPWIWRLLADLRGERSDRIRSQERAEVAAHLHDSVLQTLALIQRTDDPRRMVTLARAQERELRTWLFDRTGTDHERQLNASLEDLAARIESIYDVPIDVVTVGDAPMTPHLEAMLAATGEAASNASKHSGAARVSIYSETTPSVVSIFVTDHGKGFEFDTIGDDRHGIRESIVRRVERHGGTATITSEPGEGTEVHLEVDRV